MRDYEHDVLQVVAGLPDVPVLVGHSLGALVVQRVLQRYPARAGVLLTPIPASGAPCTVWGLARRRPSEFVRASMGGTIRLRPQDLFAQLPERQARDYASRIGRESRWAQYAMLRPEQLRQVDSPVLVVGAEQDALVGAADVRRCARDLGAELRWAAGGHDLMLDGPRDQALDLVLTWLEQHCPAGPALPGARLTQALHLG
jgi:pimeloyl-ACP methyl ester carboxylesterase